MIIESTANPKFKYAKRLLKSRNRKKEERFLLEGRPEFDHALASGVPVDMVCYTEDYISREEVDRLLYEHKVDTAVFELSVDLFNELTYQHVPGNVLGVFHTIEQQLADINPKESLIVLEQIEKPGNLGAIIRTCDALGIKQVVCTETKIDLFNPNVLRNARGATFSVACCFEENVKLLHFLRSHGYYTYAAALSEDAVDYSTLADRKGPKALILGSESKGLTSFWLDHADDMVVIPMRGVVDSLNVSVSAAILMGALLQN
jgi:TrmH family RNA methyltransferase